MVLPAGVGQLGTFKGEKGRPGTFDTASAESVPADQPAEAIISGANGEHVHFKVPRGLSGTNGDTSDTAVSTYVAAPDSATGGAVRDVAAESRGTVVDAEHATLEAALLAVATGGVVEIRTAHTRAASFTVDKPCTIRFTRAGAITVTDASIAAITVTASDVTIERPVLTGTGGSTAGTGDGIRVTATAAAPVERLQIIRPKITEFSKHGILANHVHNFVISDVDISRCAYAGIMILSAVGGSVSRGRVTDILQPTGFTNSYGVAVSRLSSGDINTTDPRSRDVVVEEITVDGVPLWEAFDTHAGENITFRNNTVYNARTGIAIIGSTDETGVGTHYAPINCSAVNNTLRSGKTDGTAGVGIVFAGAADTLGSPTELATGYITGNIIKDYGAQNSSTGCSIQLTGTLGVSVTDNVITNSGYSGIDFWYDNYGAKASGNSIVDAWSDSGGGYAVQLRSGYNKISISGTTIVRASKVAAYVNTRGLNVGAFATNLVRDGGGNDWAAATLPTNGDTVTSEMRNYAKKVGLYGVAPVARAAAISSPTADVTALKAAVDALRTAVRDVGITS